MNTVRAQYICSKLAEAYRILREAYAHDMGREPPAMNNEQLAMQELMAALGGKDREI